MIRSLFDIIIVVSTEKAWLNFPVKVEVLDCARSNLKSQLELFPLVRWLYTISSVFSGSDIYIS